MGDSSSESEPDNFVLYKDRDEWSDLKPVKQDDGPAPIVAIAYNEQFCDVYDYFRGVLRTGEKSARVLALTQDAIRMNPANYTAWHYRRLVLKELGTDLQTELDYITRIIKCHPKNYQVWYHRQLIVKWMDDASRELDFTAYILSKDSKNYHAWQHRQWAIQTYDLWKNELNYTEQLINDDIRNNSAWNQRYFVIANTTGFISTVLEQEIQYTLEIISKAKNNESPWNYLRGIVALSTYASQPSITDYCNELYSKNCRSPHLLGTMVEICVEELRDALTPSHVHLDKALQFCAELAMEYDTIRSAYWTFTADRLESKYRAVCAR